ncbi:MAG TPA: hypothetical protein VGE63_01910 [Candidatus Paceibacterota bacterium]
MISKVEVYNIAVHISAVFHVDIFNNLIHEETPEFQKFDYAKVIDGKTHVICVKQEVKELFKLFINAPHTKFTHQEFTKLIEVLCLEIYYRDVQGQPSHINYQEIDLNPDTLEDIQNHFHIQYDMRPMFCNHAHNWLRASHAA